MRFLPESKIIVKDGVKYYSDINVCMLQIVGFLCGILVGGFSVFFLI